MAAKRIDARGLACPQPVIETKNELEKMSSGFLEVLVDNQAAWENVSRFAEKSGCKVEVIPDGNDFLVKITKGTEAEIVAKEITRLQPSISEPGKAVLLITSDTIGFGSDSLGAILMRAMFPTLIEVDPKLGHIVLMNGGVELAVEGSPHLENLSALASQGVEILVCGTCLDYFKIKDKLRAGRISNFFEITETLLAASKVISF